MMSARVEPGRERPAPGLRWVVLAILLAWVIVAAPLAVGQRTLFLRDVFTTHLPLRAFGAAELAAGRVPALNSSWGLGQPFRGNPNSLAFYPSSLLYLVLPFWSAYNLHYALHWLLALLTYRLLARQMGQSRPAAWFAGLAYAGGGWMLSNLTFYNLLAVAAWWPLVMWGVARGDRRGLCVGGLACGLALLGGEPVTATLALVPLVWVAVERRGWRHGLASVFAVGALGLLVALPQVVATSRIFAFTTRGGPGLTLLGTYAFHPARLAELVLPFPFGLPGAIGLSRFWATRIGNEAPYFFTVHFGLIALALAAAALRRRRGYAALAVLGLVAAWVVALIPGGLTTLSGGVLRYPEKLLCWFALTAPLLCGWGFDRIREAPQFWARAALAGAGVLVVTALGIAWQGGAVVAWLAPALAAGELESVAAAQVPAWIRGLLVAALLLAAAGLLARRRAWAGLVLVQLVSLLGLHPLLPTAPVERFASPPRWADRMGTDRAVASATYDGGLFGLPNPEYFVKEPSQEALVTIGYEDLDFPTGVLHGLSYPLVPDLEGIQSPLLNIVARELPRLDWPGRLGWLRLLGVERLIVARPLEVPGLELLDRADRAGVPTFLYAVSDAAPRAWWPRQVERVRSVREALAAVGRQGDPNATAYVGGRIAHSHPGAVRVDVWQSDRIELVVESSAGGLVVVRRAFHPLLLARAGGGDLEILPVSVCLTGVLVPPGRHRIVLEVDALPELLGAVVAILAAALLLWGAVRPAGGARPTCIAAPAPR